MQEVLYFILGWLESTNKYIEVADGHHITEEQKGKVQIKMCNNNGNTFITTFYYVLLAPDLCNSLFSIVTLMNSVLTCLFHKCFCTVYFWEKEKNAVTFPHSAQMKHEFWGENTEYVKK